MQHSNSEETPSKDSVNQINRKKAQINATVLPSLKEEALDFLKNHNEFSSMSDLVAKSLKYYMKHYGEKTETVKL